MQRNRGRFNQKAGRGRRLGDGNMLTMEQRRLVEKQQEMLRNINCNQGFSSFPSSDFQMQSSFSPSPLLSTLGNVLPAAGLLPNLLAPNNILPAPPLMSTPILPPPPSMVPSPIDQVQSLFGSGSSSNSLYDDVPSSFRSGNSGGRPSRGFQNNNRRGQANRAWGKPKPLMSLQDPEFDQSFSSRPRFEDKSWNNKNKSNNVQRSFSNANEPRNLRDRPTHPQNQNSFSKPWNKDEVQADARPWRNKSWKDKQNTDQTFISERDFEDRNMEEMENDEEDDSRMSRDSVGHAWRKRSREDPDNSWRDAEDPSLDESCGKKFKISDSSWKGNVEESRDETWGNKSSISEGKNSTYEETSKEQEEEWGNKTDLHEENWQDNQQKSDENTSCDANDCDANDKNTSSKHPEWSEKSNDSEKKISSKNASDSGESNEPPSDKNSSSCGNFDKDSEETSTRFKKNEENLSRKDFWKTRRNKMGKKHLDSSSNFLYPDPGKKSGSGVWSRLDPGGRVIAGGKSRVEEGDLEQYENGNFLLGMGGWEGLTSRPLLNSWEESNLQLQLRYLESQLGHLDDRMLQINNLTGIPGQLTSLPAMWEAQRALLSQGEGLNNIANVNDLRMLLLDKAKGGIKEDAHADLGGWSETMVVIYPFPKITMSAPVIEELKTQLTGRIHSLLDKNLDIQPRFYGTSKVCRNWFMIDCADQQSVDWLLSWKPQIKGKTRMKLCMRKAVDAVKITHVSIFLKGIKASIRDIEIRLIHQNRHLEPDLWKRGPHSFSGNNTTVSFLVDAACLRLLETNSWEVYYELTKFKVTVVEHKPVMPLQYVNTT